jgi:hypothetical protein
MMRMIIMPHSWETNRAGYATPFRILFNDVQCFFDPQRIRCHSLEHNKTWDQVKGEVLLRCAPVSKNLGCKTIS